MSIFVQTTKLWNIQQILWNIDICEWTYMLKEMKHNHYTKELNHIFFMRTLYMWYGLMKYDKKKKKNSVW